MKDFFLGFIFMIVGGAAIFVAQTYPTMSALKFGPSLFPSLIGGGMFVGGMILSIIRLPQARKKYSSMPYYFSHLDYFSIAKSIVPCVLVVFYIVASDYLGAFICMLASIFMLMIIQGARLLISIVSAVIVAALIYKLFSGYLLIPLPDGVLF